MTNRSIYHCLTISKLIYNYLSLIGMLFQDQQKNVDPRKHLSCQNHLAQPSRSFYCYWNTNCWRTWGYEVSSSILWVKFLGSHTRTRKSIQSPNWKKCRWNSQSRITHKIVHVGMHSYIKLPNKYLIVFPIAHTDTVSHQSGVRRWTLELCGVVSRLLHCSCPPFSGPAYTLTRFSSHCCYQLGLFQVQTPPLPVLPWGTGA